MKKSGAAHGSPAESDANSAFHSGSVFRITVISAFFGSVRIFRFGSEELVLIPCIGILYEFPCAVNVLKLNVKPACVAFGNKAFDGNRACVRIGAFAVLKGECENLSQPHLVGVVIGLVKIAVALCDIALGNKILIAELNKVRSAVCAVLCEIGGNFGRELVKAPALDEKS